MSACLFFFFNNRKFGHVLPLFCFGAVAHSPVSVGTEIWHFDQLLLFQKTSSMLFGAFGNVLLSLLFVPSLRDFGPCSALPSHGRLGLCPARIWSANPAAPFLSHTFPLPGAFSVYPVFQPLGASALGLTPCWVLQDSVHCCVPGMLLRPSAGCSLGGDMARRTVDIAIVVAGTDDHCGTSLAVLGSAAGQTARASVTVSVQCRSPSRISET